MAPREVTHCRPHLTQAQARRLLALLQANPRKADASLLKKLREELVTAEEGDKKHAAWLDSQSTS